MREKAFWTDINPMMNLQPLPTKDRPIECHLAPMQGFTTPLFRL